MNYTCKETQFILHNVDTIRALAVLNKKKSDKESDNHGLKKYMRTHTGDYNRLSDESMLLDNWSFPYLSHSIPCYCHHHSYRRLTNFANPYRDQRPSFPSSMLDFSGRNESNPRGQNQNPIG